jgi:hypothetical protein
VNHKGRAFWGKSNFSSQQLTGREHLARSGEFARAGCTRITADPQLHGLGVQNVCSCDEAHGLKLLRQCPEIAPNVSAWRGSLQAAIRGIAENICSWRASRRLTRNGNAAAPLGPRVAVFSGRIRDTRPKAMLLLSVAMRRRIERGISGHYKIRHAGARGIIGVGG